MFQLTVSHIFSNQYTDLRKERLISFNINVEQVRRFKPQLVAVRNESLISELEEALNDLEEKPEIIPGEQGVIEVDIWFAYIM